MRQWRSQGITLIKVIPAKDWTFFELSTVLTGSVQPHHFCSIHNSTKKKQWNRKNMLKKILNKINFSVHSKLLRFYWFPYSVYVNKWTVSSPLNIRSLFLLSCLKPGGESSDGSKNKIKDTLVFFIFCNFSIRLCFTKSMHFREPLSAANEHFYRSCAADWQGTNLCVYSHFFSGQNRRGLCPSAIFAQQLCIHHSSHPFAAKVKSALKGARLDCLGNFGRQPLKEKRCLGSYTQHPVNSNTLVPWYTYKMILLIHSF